MKFFNYLYLFACVVSILFSAHTTQASRLEIMEGREVVPNFSSFSRRLSIYEGEGHYENNKGVSGVYRTNLSYPKVPLIHPYHPQNNGRINDGIASIPLTAHFPVSIRNGLPQAIRDELARNHVADNCLKIFLSTQNFPWNPGTVTCFRPQYATEPRATEQGYNKARQLRTGLFNSEGNRYFLRDVDQMS